MSAFSEYLNYIKEERNISGAEMARICNMDTTIIFKWLKGEHVPKSWSMILPVSERLHLSREEKDNLQTAYEKTMLGEKKYQCYQKIIEILIRLHKRGLEYADEDQKDFIEVNIKELPSFLELHNKTQIMQYIQNVLYYISTKNVKKLCLKVAPVHKEVMLLLRMALSKMQDCEVEEIVYFKEEGYDSGLYNLEILNGLIDLFANRHPLQVYAQERGRITNEVLDNWIISDEFVLEFADDFSCGMITTEPIWIEHYKTYYEKMKNAGENWGRKCFDMPDSFITEIEGTTAEIYSVEYMPCVGPCLTDRILRNNLYQELPDRNQFIYTVLEYERAVMEKRIGIGGNFFFREGLIDFMESGRVDIFPYEVYDRLDKASRIEMLERAINYSMEDDVHYHMVRERKIPALKGIYLEHRIGELGYLFVDIHFNEVRKKERFILYSELIRKEFEDFYRYLQESAYVYSQIETKEKMQEVLDFYKQKWADELDVTEPEE